MLGAIQNYSVFVSDMEKAENQFYLQRKIPMGLVSHDAVKGPMETLNTHGGRLNSIHDEFKVELIEALNEAVFEEIWNNYVELMYGNGLTEVMEEANRLYNEQN